MSQLRDCAGTQLKHKHENTLLCTSAFEPSLSGETNRGLANITHIWGVWLDIDGGSMPKEEIPLLFPHLRMAVFNSWSPGNYRIFIPTTQYMSTGTYDEVMKQLVQAVEGIAPEKEYIAAQCMSSAPWKI